MAVKAGDMIEGTSYRVLDLDKQFVSAKQGNGKMVDVSRITVEDTESGAKHLLVKDIAAHSAETYAVLTTPDSSYRYVVRTDDRFTTPPRNPRRAGIPGDRHPSDSGHHSGDRESGSLHHCPRRHGGDGMKLFRRRA